MIKSFLVFLIFKSTYLIIKNNLSTLMSIFILSDSSHDCHIKLYFQQQHITIIQFSISFIVSRMFIYIPASSHSSNSVEKEGKQKLNGSSSFVIYIIQLTPFFILFSLLWQIFLISFGIYFHRNYLSNLYSLYTYLNSIFNIIIILSNNIIIIHIQSFNFNIRDGVSKQSIFQKIYT